MNNQLVLLQDMSIPYAGAIQRAAWKLQSQIEKTSQRHRRTCYISVQRTEKKKEGYAMHSDKGKKNCLGQVRKEKARVWSSLVPKEGQGQKYMGDPLSRFT